MAVLAIEHGWDVRYAGDGTLVLSLPLDKNKEQDC